MIVRGRRVLVWGYFGRNGVAYYVECLFCGDYLLLKRIRGMGIKGVEG